MTPFKVGQKVRIKQNQAEGIIKEAWTDGHIEKYVVRYADSNGLLADKWMFSDEFEAVED